MKRRVILSLLSALLVLTFSFFSAYIMRTAHAMPATTNCPSGLCEANLAWTNINTHGAGTYFTVDDPGTKGGTGFISYTKSVSVWEKASDHLDMGIVENDFCGTGLYYYYALFNSGNNPFKCSPVNAKDVNHIVHFQASWYVSNGGGLIVETAGTQAGDELCPASNPCYVSDSNFARYPVDEVIYATYLWMTTITGHEVWGGEWVDNSYYTGTSWAWDATSGNIIAGNPNQMRWESPPKGGSNAGGTLYSCTYPSGNMCTLGS